MTEAQRHLIEQMAEAAQRPDASDVVARAPADSPLEQHARSIATALLKPDHGLPGFHVAGLIRALAAKVEGLRRPVACGVCLGEPLASGKKCVCGGIGTEQAEMQGLREMFFDLERETTNREMVQRVLADVQRERDAARAVLRVAAKAMDALSKAYGRTHIVDEHIAPWADLNEAQRVVAAALGEGR